MPISNSQNVGRDTFATVPIPFKTSTTVRALSKLLTTSTATGGGSTTVSSHTVGRQSACTQQTCGTRE